MKTTRYMLSKRYPCIRGAVGREPLIGLVAALLCAMLWAVLTHYTGKDLAYGALGVGIVVGLAIALSAKTRRVDNGISAAGLTAIAVLLGKLIIVQWGLNTTISAADHSPVSSSAPIQQRDGSTTTHAQPIDASAQPIDTTFRSDQNRVIPYSRIGNALTATDLVWLGLSVVVAFLIGIGKPQSTPHVASLNDHPDNDSGNQQQEQRVNKASRHD